MLGIFPVEKSGDVDFGGGADVSAVLFEDAADELLRAERTD